MPFLKLLTANNDIEANLIKTKLEDEGIRCFLINRNFANLLPIYNGMMGSGIRVMIDEADMNHAIEILRNKPENQEIGCPHCGSENIKFGLGPVKRGKITLIIISLLCFLPFGNVKNTYYCKNCKREFQISKL